MWTSADVTGYHLCFFFVRKVKGVQSALRKLSEQSFWLLVFEAWNKMDLEDLRESLGESRSLEMFPVQGETENFLK